MPGSFSSSLLINAWDNEPNEQEEILPLPLSFPTGEEIHDGQPVIPLPASILNFPFRVCLILISREMNGQQLEQAEGSQIKHSRGISKNTHAIYYEQGHSIK